jgi:hypothetical protein
VADEGLAAGQSGQATAGLPGAGPQPDGRTEPMVHYSYLGLAMLLYGVLTAWSIYHVRELASRLEVAGHELPVFALPLFRIVPQLGLLLYLPLFAFVLLEIVMPRKLTKLWLASTLLLLVVGVYVAVALWAAARGQATP